MRLITRKTEENAIKILEEMGLKPYSKPVVMIYDPSEGHEVEMCVVKAVDMIELNSKFKKDPWEKSISEINIEMGLNGKSNIKIKRD